MKKFWKKVRGNTFGAIFTHFAHISGEQEFSKTKWTLVNFFLLLPLNMVPNFTKKLMNDY